MEKVIVFVLSYIFIFLIYEIFIVYRAIKNKDDESKKKPIEVRFLINKYGVDINKINYTKLLHVIALISSFDIALIAAVMALFKSLIVEIIVGLIIVLSVTYISYNYLGKKYRKKMKDNE